MPCAVLYKECVRKNGANVVKNLGIGNKMQGKHDFLVFRDYKNDVWLSFWKANLFLTL